MKSFQPTKIKKTTEIISSKIKKLKSPPQISFIRTLKMTKSSINPKTPFQSFQTMAVKSNQPS
jgi:hypothetical protein